MFENIYKKVGRKIYSHYSLRKWMPMKMYLQCYWRERLPECGELNLRNPQTVAEKQQWIKIHDHKDIYTTLADKYRSKEWLGQKFGYEHIIKNIMSYEKASDINIEELPAQFVLKCNHDSGSVYICKDKNTGIFYDKHMDALSFNDIQRKLDEGLHKDYYYEKREWCYKNIKPCIFAEEYLVRRDGSMPDDFKLVFINGKFEYVYVSYDREGINDRCIYDAKWDRLPFVWGDAHSFEEGINTSKVPKPVSFDEMLRIGEEISKLYRFVRVDFYDVDGKAFIGEITQFHTAGFARYNPKEYDMYYGKKIDINKKI